MDDTRASLRDLNTNSLETIDADHVLLADGKAALLGSRARPAMTNDLGIKAHFSNIRGPRDAIELFGLPGHYGGLAPVEDGLWNASFAVPAERVHAARGDVEQLWQQLVSENRTLAQRMHGATRTGSWLAAPLPRFPVVSRDDWPPRVIPIGNAVAALEPIGGEGIGLAMRSAELAAGAIVEAIATHTELNRVDLYRQFARLWRPRRFMCRLAAMLLSRPRLAEWLIRSLNPGDPLPQLGLQLAGKCGAAIP
jgi:flavin-dependent dehydrogenase